VWQKIKNNEKYKNGIALECEPYSFDDNSVLLYKIPEGSLTEHMTQEIQICQKTFKKIFFCHFLSGWIRYCLHN
jgi:hypothetical protein